MINITGYKGLSEIVQDDDEHLSLEDDELKYLLTDNFRNEVQAEIDRLEKYRLQRKIEQDVKEKIGTAV